MTSLSTKWSNGLNPPIPTKKASEKNKKPKLNSSIKTLSEKNTPSKTVSALPMFFDPNCIHPEIMADIEKARNREQEQAQKQIKNEFNLTINKDGVNYKTLLNELQVVVPANWDKIKGNLTQYHRKQSTQNALNSALHTALLKRKGLAARALASVGAELCHKNGSSISNKEYKVIYEKMQDGRPDKSTQVSAGLDIRNYVINTVIQVSLNQLIGQLLGFLRQVLQEAGQRLGLKMFGQDMRNTNFQSYNMNGMSFNGANLKNCNFKEASLMGARFINCNLKNANFQNANLTQAQFIGCNINGINIKDATLTGTVFNKPVYSQPVNTNPAYGYGGWGNSPWNTNPYGPTDPWNQQNQFQPNPWNSNAGVNPWNTPQTNGWNVNPGPDPWNSNTNQNPWNSNNSGTPTNQQEQQIPQETTTK